LNPREFTDVHEMQEDFAEKVKMEFNRMIDGQCKLSSMKATTGQEIMA